MGKKWATEDETGMTSAKAARIIVNDTIRSAYSTPGLNGEEVVRAGIAALRGSDGERLTQAMIAEYLGSDGAGQAAGVAPAVDIRMLQQGVVKVYAEPLREEMARGLETFLGLPEAERATRIRAIVKEKVEPTPQPKINVRLSR